MSFDLLFLVSLLFVFSALCICAFYQFARPLNRLNVEGGTIIYRGRFYKKWSIERSAVTLIERNALNQSITLVSSEQRYSVALKHLSICSACALAELTMSALEVKTSR